ncbi:hypothetical protein [Kocuria kalidii]|uniref:hypothetical protein n=1 Tax=Kocuria kalidii TaxID=3376283 RepID=UPI0037946239
MSRKAVQRWIFGVATALFLAAGVLQLFHGLPLGWAAVVSAALIGSGLALAVMIRWGRLLSVRGLMTGIVWLLAMLFELIGRGYAFSYAGWAVGITTATYFFWQDYQDDRAGYELNESTGSQDTLYQYFVRATRLHGIRAACELDRYFQGRMVAAWTLYGPR